MGVRCFEISIRRSVKRVRYVQDAADSGNCIDLNGFVALRL